jgi:hypothetical protein
MTTIEQTDSFYTQYCGKLVEETTDLLRIDRVIQEFFQNPTCSNDKPLLRRVITLSVACVFYTYTSLYVTAVNVAFLIATNALCRTPLFAETWQKVPSFSTYFTSNQPGKDTLAATVGLIGASQVNRGIVVGFEKLYDKLKVTCNEAQDVAKIIKRPGPLAKGLAAYAVVGAPLIEETLFRGFMTDYLKISLHESRCGKTDHNIQQIRKSEIITNWDKFVIALKVNTLFALVHLSPAQGWLNPSIAAFCFTLGMACSLLTEYSGSLVPATLLHALNNLLAVINILS